MNNDKTFSRREKKELIVGIVVILVCAIYFMYLNSRKLEEVKQQNIGSMISISADFNKTDGLFVGSVVRLAGVDIGSVSDTSLLDDFTVNVVMDVKEDVLIPEDSGVTINTAGLFGSKYIEIQPGGMDEYLEDGGVIEYTQDSMIVQDLIDRIISIGKSKKEKRNQAK